MDSLGNAKVLEDPFIEGPSDGLCAAVVDGNGIYSSGKVIREH